MTSKSKIHGIYGGKMLGELLPLYCGFSLGVLLCEYGILPVAGLKNRMRYTRVPPHSTLMSERHTDVPIPGLTLP